MLEEGQSVSEMSIWQGLSSQFDKLKVGDPDRHFGSREFIIEIEPTRLRLKSSRKQKLK